MKKRLSIHSRMALAASAGLTLCCGLFALIIAFAAAHPDPQTNTSTVRNPLDGATDGVSMLLRADQSNDEYFAANRFPTLNGAKGDGVSDDTKPLKESLEAAATEGGTVYLPQGIYRITEPLTIPADVTLRGDFSAPDSKTSHGEKTILLVEDSTAMRESPFLTLKNGASVIGITIYYEKQSPETIIEYPAAIYSTGETSMRQIALLNPYHGICVTGTGKVDIRSVWISPLDYGILVTDNNNAVTVEDCSVSPAYWLNYAPAVFSDGEGYSAMTEYLHEQMHGLILEEVTDVTLNRIFVEDAAVGILFNVPKEQDSVLLAKETTVSSSERPIYIQSLPTAGICFSDCTFRPDNDAGADTVQIAQEADAPVVFSNCTFAGLPKTVIKADNNSFVSFYHCNFGTWWDVCFDMEGDTFLAVSPTFKTENEKATLGQNAFGLLYNAEAIEESSQLLFSVPKDDAKITVSNTVTALKDIQRTFTNGPVINALTYGVSTQSEDNTAAMNAAFAAAEDQGGTVFLPEGIYKFKSIITVPQSVRLVGVGSSGKYSTVLSFDLQKNTNFSLVELKPNASVEDLQIHQASILADSVNTYAISSLYSDICICRVWLTAGRGIWLTSAKNAVIEHVTMNVTQTGLYLQTMKNVTVRDLTVSDPSGSYGTTGIRIEDSTATLSGIRGIKLACAIELLKQTDLTATLISLRAPSVGIKGSHTGSAVITAVGCSESGQGGNTVFLQGDGAMTGSVTVQGLISTGTTLLGNLVSAQNGTVEIRAGVFTTPFTTTITAADQANISVYGCIWDTTPTYHATATGGTVTLAANLLRSDKTFEGIEGNYMLTSTGEESGTVNDDVNIIQHVYVYVESEDASDPTENKTAQESAQS